MAKAMVMATGMKMQPAKLDHGTGRRFRHGGRRVALGGALGLLVSAVWAQSSQSVGAAPVGSSIQTRLSVSQSFTDNLRLSEESQQDKAFITTVSPGLNVVSRSGFLRGSLDYSLNGLLYMKTAQRDQVQQALSAQATLEAVPNWFFIDGRASIGQQAISAFGVAAADSNLVNANRTEVASLSLSPYLRGRAAGLVDYELRAETIETRAKDTQIGDGSTRSALLSLKGIGDGRALNWSATLRDQQSQPRSGRDTQTLSATLGLTYRPDIDWRFGANAGRERSDLQSAAARTGTTYGVSAIWTPGPRTKLDMNWSHQVYGSTHGFVFEHRMARTVWRYSDTRAVTTAFQGGSGTQSNYELLFLQFAAIEPDPIKRDVLVRQYLQSLGLGAGSTTTNGFLSSSSNLTRRQDLSMSWQNQLSTVTLSVNQSNSRRLDPNDGTAGDLSRSSGVLQRGYSLSLAHRLSPQQSLSATLQQTQSRGDLGSQATDLKSITASWNAKLGRRSSIQLGSRHSNFDSVARRYRENSVFATFIQQF